MSSASFPELAGTLLPPISRLRSTTAPGFGAADVAIAADPHPGDPPSATHLAMTKIGARS
jgi:hypothetical protein